MLGEFRELGCLGPLRILSAEACRHLGAMSREPSFPAPLDWAKGHAVTSRAIYDIAVTPAILDVVSQLLGPNILLWGASLVQRPPGSIHPWHSDMESSAPGVRGVSVWLGIENTSVDSSLQFISRSHHLGSLVQDFRHERNIGRDQATTESVLGWAREIDSRCEFIKPTVSDGQAIFFDGRLWHYTENRSSQTRVALLLQYATVDVPLRMPDFSYVDRPFRTFTLPQPPCLLVRGESPSGINRIVQAPPQPASGPGLCLRDTRVCQLQLPLATNPVTGWRPFPIFGGETGDIRTISCHVSSLTPGTHPHPPHGHSEEEMVIVLDGEVQVVLPDLAASRDSQPGGSQTIEMQQGEAAPDNLCRRTLRRGEFVYYPSEFAHTLINTGSRPANYLMLKWENTARQTSTPLPFGHYNALQPPDAVESHPGFSHSTLFEGPTAWLRKLHCHFSTLAAGASHAAHYDAHDVAIILFEGELDIAGARVGPNSVIYHPAGVLHGLCNPGTVTARYLVFEFHGSQQAKAEPPAIAPEKHSVPAVPVAVHQPASPPVPPPSFLTKVRDPQRWKRKLKHLSRRITG